MINKSKIRSIPRNKSKYGNRKTIICGIEFDSKHEAERYLFLKALEQQGKISDLQLQVPYELIPTKYENPEKHKGVIIRGVNYVADFVYIKDGITVVEDAKGMRTDAYIIKKKLMYDKYGIMIQEV